MKAIDHQELETARQLLAEIIDQPPASVPLDANVQNFPAWDSLVHVRILLAIEAETGCLLDSDLISNLKTLQDIADALRRR